MKSYIFLDATPRSPLKTDRRFGETHYLHLQCPRISQARKQHEASSKQSTFIFFTFYLLHAGFLLGLIFDPDD
jgi:hypothetical protein